ncbi:hypothetical protein HPP92_008762 [Vanilla planifolia]|uniref:Uncharacterized protein n=1 Tax=Vanilla planifolia TaxID=51239 RepID=A0A835RDY2_VANPL|nr:hypothetical protein HPP92_008762 [Vanilla planifolia]
MLTEGNDLRHVVMHEGVDKRMVALREVTWEDGYNKEILKEKSLRKNWVYFIERFYHEFKRSLRIIDA